jgi:hypothetical protein
MSGKWLSADQLKQLRNEFTQYNQHASNYRENAFHIRNRAFAHIRSLVAPDKLATLSLDDFDRHIWQIGHLINRGVPVGWHEASSLLGSISPDKFTRMVASGEIGFVGNISWGSAAKTLRAFAHGRSRTQVEADMKRAVTLLLRPDHSLETSLRQLRTMGIGFGRNISTGLLMAWQPKQHIIYNSRSEKFWNMLGVNVSAGNDWVPAYLRYNALCHSLLNDPNLNLKNLVELDIFLDWYTPLDSRASSPQPRKIRSRSPKETSQPLPEEGLDDPHAVLDQQINQIRRFLQGRADRPSDEVLCDWVQFCYTFQLFSEGVELFRLIDPSAVDAWPYERARRLAQVCRIRAR